MRKNLLLLAAIFLSAVTHAQSIAVDEVNEVTGARYISCDTYKIKPSGKSLPINIALKAFIKDGSFQWGVSFFYIAGFPIACKEGDLIAIRLMNDEVIELEIENNARDNVGKTSYNSFLKKYETDYHILISSTVPASDFEKIIQNGWKKLRIVVEKNKIPNQVSDYEFTEKKSMELWQELNSQKAAIEERAKTSPKSTENQLSDF